MDNKLIEIKDYLTKIINEYNPPSEYITIVNRDDYYEEGYEDGKVHLANKLLNIMENE